jgi:2'-5' RNA ligase
MQDPVDEYLNQFKTAVKPSGLKPSSPTTAQASGLSDPVDEYLGRFQKTPAKSLSTPVAEPIDEDTRSPLQKAMGVPRAVKPTVTSETDKRYQEAAKAIRQIEQGRNRAVELFKQADQTDQGQIATGNAKPGTMTPPQFDSTGRPVRDRDRLRAEAEGELQAANFFADATAKKYGDLVEVGFGKDTDPNSRRVWAYAKPKAVKAQVIVDSEGRPSREFKDGKKVGELRDVTIENPLVDLYRQDDLDEKAIRSRPEDIRRSKEQQRRIRTERERYEGRSLPGQVAERLTTEFLSGVPDMTPEQRRDLAERRTALGISDELRTGADTLGRVIGGGARELASLPQAAAEFIDQLPGYIAESGRAMPGIIPRPMRFTAPGKGVSGAVKPYTDVLEKTVAGLTPIDETDDSFRAKLLSGVGSLLGFAAGGAVGRGLKIPLAVSSPILGAGFGIAQVVKDMDSAGINPIRRDAAIAMAGANGLTEAFGVGRILDKFGLKQSFIKRAVDVAEEFGQEGLQTYLENVNAAVIGAYDPNRPLSRGVLEAAVIGGVLGGGTQILSAGAEYLKNRKTKPVGRGATPEAASQPAPSTVQASPAATPPAPDAANPPTQPRTAPFPAPVGAETSQFADAPSTTVIPPASTTAPTPEGAIPPEALPPAKRSILDRVLGRNPEPTTASGVEIGPDVDPIAEQLKRLQQFVSPQKPPADAKSAKAAEIEAQRSATFNQAQSLAQEAGNRAADLVSQGDFESAITEFDGQKDMLQQAIRALPNRPDALKTRAELKRQVSQIDAQMKGIRKQSASAAKASPPSTVAISDESTERLGQATNVLNPSQQTAEPSPREVFRAEADQAKIDASALEEDGRFTDAVREYEASHSALKRLRATFGRAANLSAQDAAIVSALDREISIAASNKGRVAQLARAATTAQRQEAKKPQAQPRAVAPASQQKQDERTAQIGESAPLLSQVSNPQGGVPEIAPPSVNFERLAERQERGKGERLDNTRINARIRQLGGINPAGQYTGELQSAVDKRYPGLINRRSGIKPDELREILRQDGYEVGEDLDSLFRAIDDDIAGKAQYPLTRSRSEEISRGLAEYYEQMAQEDDVLTRPTERELVAATDRTPPARTEPLTGPQTPPATETLTARRPSIRELKPVLRETGRQQSSASAEVQSEEQSRPLSRTPEIATKTPEAQPGQSLQTADRRSSAPLVETERPKPPAAPPAPERSERSTGSNIEQFRDDIPPEEFAALERALRSYRGAGTREDRDRDWRRGSDEAKFSFSEYADLVSNNPEKIERLYQLDLRSEEAQEIIGDLWEFASKRKITGQHIGNLLNFIRNDQLDRAKLADRKIGSTEALTDPSTGELREYYSREDELYLEEQAVNTGIQAAAQKLSAADLDWIQSVGRDLDDLLLAINTDPDLMEAYEAALTGTETDINAFEDLANVFGYDPETVRYLVGVNRTKLEAESRRNADRVQEKAAPAAQSRDDQRPPRVRLSDDRRRLIEINPEQILDQDLDPLIESITTIINDGVRGSFFGGVDLTPRENDQAWRKYRQLNRERNTRREVQRIEEKQEKDYTPTDAERSTRYQLMREMQSDPELESDPDLSSEEKKRRSKIRESRLQALILKQAEERAGKPRTAEPAAKLGPKSIPAKGIFDADLGQFENEKIQKGIRAAESYLALSGGTKKERKKMLAFLTRANAELESRKGKKEESTLAHPDPDLDGKPIVGKTADGRVIVANPENVSGVSVVKDRSDEETEYKSSSTQVLLPKDIAERVIRFGKQIPEADLAENGREDNPHITVLYGLRGSRSDQVREILDGETAIKATLGKISLFTTNPDFDVVKIEVRSDDLTRLYEAIKEGAPNEQSFPEYNPHVTIGYVKKGKGNKYVGNTDFQGVDVTFDKVQFSGRFGNKEDIKLEKTAETKEESPESQPTKTENQAASQSDKSLDNVAKGLGDLFGVPTASQKAKESAKEAIKGLDDVAKGLSELFGGGGNKNFSGGIAFDQETYAKAKPYFQEAYAHFKGSAKNAADALKLLLNELKSRYGFDENTIEALRPYAERYANDSDPQARDAEMKSLRNRIDPLVEETEALEDLSYDLDKFAENDDSFPKAALKNPAVKQIWDDATNKAKALVEEFRAAEIPTREAELTKIREEGKQLVGRRKVLESENERLQGQVEKLAAKDEDNYDEIDELQAKQATIDGELSTIEDRLSEIDDSEYELKEAAKALRADTKAYEKIVQRNLQFDDVEFSDYADLSEPLGEKITAIRKDVVAQIDQKRADLERELEAANKRYEELEEIELEEAEELDLDDEASPVTPEPKIITDARQRIQDAASGKRAGSGAQQLADLALIVGWNTYKTGIDFAKWSESVVRMVGEKVRPYLREVWRSIQQNADLRREESLFRQAKGFILDAQEGTGRAPILYVDQNIYKKASVFKGTDGAFFPIAAFEGRGGFEEQIRSDRSLTEKEAEALISQIGQSFIAAKKKGLFGVSIASYASDLQAARQVGQHESFHVGQSAALGITDDAARTIRNSKVLLSNLHDSGWAYQNPFLNRIMGMNLGKEISGGDINVLAYELPAYIASGELFDIRKTISPKEAFGYLFDYLDHIYEYRGENAFDEIERVAHLNREAKGVFNAVRQERAQRSIDPRSVGRWVGQPGPPSQRISTTPPPRAERGRGTPATVAQGGAPRQSTRIKDVAPRPTFAASITSGAKIDEGTYTKAKPYFEEAFKQFWPSVKNAGEVVDLLFDTLKSKYGFSEDALDQMEPYVQKFAKEMKGVSDYRLLLEYDIADLWWFRDHSMNRGHLGGKTLKSDIGRKAFERANAVIMPIVEDFGRKMTARTTKEYEDQKKIVDDLQAKVDRGDGTPAEIKQLKFDLKQELRDLSITKKNMEKVPKVLARMRRDVEMGDIEELSDDSLGDPREFQKLNRQFTDIYTDYIGIALNQELIKVESDPFKFIDKQVKPEDLQEQEEDADFYEEEEAEPEEVDEDESLEDDDSEPEFVAGARKRLKDAVSGNRAGSGAEQLFDMAIVAGYRVYRAGMDFTEWSAAVIKQVGSDVRPHLRTAWESLIADTQSAVEEARDRQAEYLEELQSKQAAKGVRAAELGQDIRRLEKIRSILEQEARANQQVGREIPEAVGRDLQRTTRELEQTRRGEARNQALSEQARIEQGPIRFEQARTRRDEKTVEPVRSRRETAEAKTQRAQELEQRLASLRTEREAIEADQRRLKAGGRSIPEKLTRRLEQLESEIDQNRKDLARNQSLADQARSPQPIESAATDDRGQSSTEYEILVPNGEKKAPALLVPDVFLDNLGPGYNRRTLGFLGYLSQVSEFKAAIRISRNMTAEQKAIALERIDIASRLAKERGLSSFAIIANGAFKDSTRFHEAFHVGQDEAANLSLNPGERNLITEKEIKSLHSPLWAVNHPLINEAFKKPAIAKRFRGDKQLMAMEMPAYILAGQLDILSPVRRADGSREISTGEAVDFLLDYLQHVVEKNGVAALDRIQQVAHIPPGYGDVFELARSGFGKRSTSEGTAERAFAGGDRRTFTGQRAPIAAELSEGSREFRDISRGVSTAEGSGADRRTDQRAAETIGRKDRGIIGDFLSDEGGSASLGLGLQKLATPTAPKTTPLRAIADQAGEGKIIIDPQALAKETLDTLVEAAGKGKGKYGTLPGSRAMYWYKKLGQKSVGKALGADARATAIRNRQAAFIGDAIAKITTIADASTKMAAAQRGSRAYQDAQWEMDRARVQLANMMSKVGDYSHPLEYATKAYRASILSAPHIPVINMAQQFFQIPFHEAQKAAEILVPTGVMNKWGIPYEKAASVSNYQEWIPAIAREFRGIRDGVAKAVPDVVDMLWYGVTRQMLDNDLADEILQKRKQTKDPAKRQKITGGTDRYELGNRARGIPGLDRIITGIGRAQGAADILFRNIAFATALNAQATATAKKLAKANPSLKLTEAQVKELAADMAYEPSPAMIAMAAEESNRFVLDYPTLPYEALVKLKDLEGIKKGGRHVEAAWKAAFDFLIPFSKIPLAAVDTALFRYTPAGLIRAGSRLAKAKGEQAIGKRKGETIEQTPEFGQETAELLRQGAVGTLTYMALGALGTLGYLGFTGGRDDDDDRRRIDNAKEILNQPFKPELTAGDYAVDVSKMGAIGQGTGTALRVLDASKRRYDEKAGDYEPQSRRMGRTAVEAVKGAMIMNPIGSAIEEQLEVLKSKSPEGAIAQLGLGKARALVPGAVREVAKIADGTRRIPDNNDFRSRLLGDLQSGIPGMRGKMQPRLNALGEPVKEQNPFFLWRKRDRNPLLEDMIEQDQGVTKPKREAGTTAAEYNEQLRASGAQIKDAFSDLQDLQGKSPEARRAIYSRSMNPTQLDRSERISDESEAVERELEALRADAFTALNQMREYRALNVKQQSAIRKAIGEEIATYRGKAGSIDKRGRAKAEKMAVMPDWTPESLARAAIDNADR